MLDTNPSKPEKSAQCKVAQSDSCAFSIFQLPWWLDAVAPGQWNEVTVESGGHIVGRLPYVLQRRRGMTRLAMPMLNQYLGPWVDTGAGKYVTRLSNQHKIFDELIGQLPPFDAFQQHFAPNITNWLPFYWAGFEATVRYTYRIERLSDLDAIWSGVRENIRREIRKAEKALVVRDDLGIERFMDTYIKTFQRQAMDFPFERDFIARVDQACRQHQSGKTLFAVDAKDRVHSAVYYAWNANTCFYLMSGADPDLRNSGATSLLVWEGIKLAQTVSASFDFEGSMVPSIERFMRSFGARQTPYFHVTKYSRRLQCAKSLKNAWKALRAKHR